jgi:hypothetical protein
MSMRHKHLHQAVVTVVGVIAALEVLGSTNSAQSGCASENFTAAAVTRGDSDGVLASSVDIHIVRWSTETQKDRFARTRLDRGPAALLEALRSAAPVGQLRSASTFAYDFQFAWQEPLEDGGRRIVLIGDRPMFVWKEEMGLEEEDGAIFTVVEIRLRPDGDGEGKVAIGSHATVNRSLDLIELKNYDSESVQLRNVSALPRQT